MATIEIAGGELRVQLSFPEKVLAFQGVITVSLLHVEHAEPYTGSFPTVGEVYRFSGTYVPRHHIAGTESVDEEHEVFYDVNDPKKAVLIELKDDNYKRLIVEIDEQPPEAVAAFINDEAAKQKKMAAQSHRIREELASS